MKSIKNQIFNNFNKAIFMFLAVMMMLAPMAIGVLAADT